MPTVIGEKSEIIDSGIPQLQQLEPAEKKTYKFGHQAYARKEEYKLLEDPIRRGRICEDTDWENMTKIWDEIFKELGVDSRHINVLMTDSPFSEKRDKTKMIEIMFEHFKVKSF